MNAQTPPSRWASAMMWYISVVLPDDSGPKTSTMRPRGMPPMPSARSSDSAPVGIALTLTWAPSSPMRMTVPLPNWRSIWVRAPASAVSRALMAFSSVAGISKYNLSLRGSGSQCGAPIGRNRTVRVFVCRACGGSSRLAVEGATGQRLVARRAAAQPRAHQHQAPHVEVERRRRRQRAARRRPAVPDARDGQVRPEAPPLALEAHQLQLVPQRAVQRVQRLGVVVDLDGQHVRAARRQPQRPARAQRRRRPALEVLDEVAQRPDLVGRAVPEEGQRQVDLLGVDDAHAAVRADRLARPLDEHPALLVADLQRDEQPGAHGAAASPRSTRRTRCIATVVERSRTSKRLPGSTNRRVSRAPSRVATEKHTVPTGLSSVPPPGPAMPVMPTPTSASSAAQAPSASASATSTDTAPTRSISAGSTPVSLTLASLEYTTRPP